MLVTATGRRPPSHSATEEKGESKDNNNGPWKLSRSGAMPLEWACWTVESPALVAPENARQGSPWIGPGSSLLSGIGYQPVCGRLTARPAGASRPLSPCACQVGCHQCHRLLSSTLVLFRQVQWRPIRPGKDQSRAKTSKSTKEDTHLKVPSSLFGLHFPGRMTD
jgi:hypothetical protein